MKLRDGLVHGADLIVRGEGETLQCRRIELVLDESTWAGLTQLRLWRNLPPEVTAKQIANLFCQLTPKST